MSVQHNITRNWSSTGGAQLSQKVATIADAEVNIDVGVASGVTNQAMGLTLVVAKIKSLFWLSNRDITVKTNSTSSPDQTFTLKAGVPLEWTASDTQACPITTNIATTIYLTNASGLDAVLNFRTAYNL